MNIQFQYPQAFWLLAAIPVFILLFSFYLLWRRRAVKRMGDAGLVKALTPTHSTGKVIYKFSLFLIAFALGCVAIANPRRPDEMRGEARKGIDVMLALDVSNSMLAEDIAPSRLLRAKAMLTKLIDAMPNNRVGFTLFAGQAYIQMPLTTDHGAAKMYVDAAEPTAVATQGTAIGDALKKSAVAFGETSDRFKAIVLVSDGETWDEDAIMQAQELAARGIMVNTVGIGSEQGSTIVDSSGVGEKRDAGGAVIVSKLNAQLLQQVATTTNGIYVNQPSAQKTVDELMAQLSQIEGKALNDSSLFTYHTYYAWLALPMLLLLLGEMFLSDRKKLKK